MRKRGGDEAEGHKDVANVNTARSEYIAKNRLTKELCLQVKILGVFVTLPINF